MYPRGGHVGVKGGVFDQCDVGDGGAARHRALDQVVAEHQAFGQALVQHGVHGLHVEQCLAGVGPFEEHVLVDLGAGRAVGVDAALAGKQPVEQGEVARCRQGRGDARLQDAVAAGHHACAWVDLGLVVGVCSDAHQLAQAAGGKLRVAVERDDVRRVRRDARGLAQVEERTGVTGGQRGDQLLQLAALALPAEPALFGAAEAPHAVQQDEARCLALGGGVAIVELADLCDGGFEKLVVTGDAGCIGIGPVAQQGELRMALRVGEVVQLQVVRQRAGGRFAAQQARDHHHHPVRRRDAFGQRQARQVVRSHRLADQAVDHRHHRLGGREQHQHDAQHGQPERHAGQLGRVAQQQPGDARQGHQRAAEVERQGPAMQHVEGHGRRCFAQIQGPQQGGAAWAVEPMAGHGGCRVDAFGALFQVEQGLRHVCFGAAAAPGQLLDAMQRLVTREGVLGGEDGRGEHEPHQRVAAGHDVGPVGVADGAQRGHGVAHAQVVGGLVGRLLRALAGQVGQGGLQPLFVVRDLRGRGGSAQVFEALRQLAEEGPPHAALVEQGQQLVERGEREGVQLVTAQVGHFACGLVGGHALCQAAQVLDQHHTQGGGQRPHLGELELARFLVRAQVA